MEMGTILVTTDFSDCARQALSAAALLPQTRRLGLSLGDRACLALARTRGKPAVTADRAWAELDVDITVRLIR